MGIGIAEGVHKSERSKALSILIEDENGSIACPLTWLYSLSNNLFLNFSVVSLVAFTIRACIESVLPSA